MIILFSDMYGFFDKIPNNSNNKIAFIINARDTYENNECLPRDKEFLENKKNKVEYINLKDYSQEELYNKLLSFNIIYITGGNSFYLLEIIRKSGFDKILPKLLDKGITYWGESAGAIIMCNSIEPTILMDYPEYANLTNYKGLNYINLVLLPHYQTEKYTPKIEEIEKQYSKDFKLKKLTNKQGVIIQNKEITFIDH